jgi:hypothetical protein
LQATIDILRPFVENYVFIVLDLLPPLEQYVERLSSFPVGSSAILAVPSRFRLSRAIQSLQDFDASTRQSFPFNRLQSGKRGGAITRRDDRRRVLRRNILLREALLPIEQELAEIGARLLGLGDSFHYIDNIIAKRWGEREFGASGGGLGGDQDRHCDRRPRGPSKRKDRGLTCAESMKGHGCLLQYLDVDASMR